MKVVVNKDNCIGCGACEALYPEVFQIDDEGLSTVISNDNLDEEKLWKLLKVVQHLLYQKKNAIVDVKKEKNVLAMMIVNAKKMNKRAKKLFLFYINLIICC